MTKPTATTNPVQVDELDIASKFDQLEAQAEVDEKTIELEQAAVSSDESSWVPAAAMVIDIVDAKVCPAWELSDKEKHDLTGTIAECLDRYFPGALAGFDNWHPISKLAFVTGAISIQRFDWHHGTFAPMHPRRDDDDDSPQEGRDPNGDHRVDPIGKDTVGFATSPE